MFELYEINENEWQLHAAGEAFSGPFVKVIALGIMKYDFLADEFDVAVTEMVKNGHDAAHFGFGRRFIYSFNKEAKYEKKAG